MVLALIPILLAHRIDPASAADSNALAEPVALPTVVVTPTRLPTPESEVGSSITVITDEEIQRKQKRTLPDARA
jgi:vitamin B12 transporter